MILRGGHFLGGKGINIKRCILWSILWSTQNRMRLESFFGGGGEAHGLLSGFFLGCIYFLSSEVVFDLIVMDTRVKLYIVWKELGVYSNRLYNEYCCSRPS